MISAEDTQNRKSRKKGSKEHPYFQGHECYIPSYMLSKHEFKCSKIRTFFLNLVVVRQADPRAKVMFRSYDAMSAERYRQYKYYPASIHPYSSFRLAIELLIIITIFITNVMISIHYSTTIPRHYPVFEKIIRTLESLYLINILVNFFTGFVTGITMKYVVLDLRRIIWRYLSTWFVVDVLSSGFIVSTKDVKLTVVMCSIKILRMPTMIYYMSNVLAAFKISILKKVLVQSFVYLSMFLTWNIFFQFAVEYFEEGDFTPSHPRECSWMSIAGLWNETFAKRLAYSFDRAVGMLRENSNLHLLIHDGCFEIFFVVSGILAKLLVLHCSLKYMIALFGTESARAKYYMMTQQVQRYMEHRKFPPRIKKKILKFYAIRFQSHYFNEEKMISCVSGKLREDIIMHTGRQLLSDLKFLKTMPRALLLQLEMKLKIVVFIAGDIILKINTVGDCLYFIDKGTVAVYSESGKEVCHLYDGDFFGEIALVMKHRIRTASVVAVTNCELFRLDREDFESTIACYPTVYEDIKQVATHRSEETSLIDENYKSELKAYVTGSREKK